MPAKRSTHTHSYMSVSIACYVVEYTLFFRESETESDERETESTTRESGRESVTVRE
jgi:hypothetical protein